MGEILKLAPAFKDYIWGGSFLKTEYNVTDMDRVAEAWVLSCHKDGASTVIGGKYDGKTLSEALSELGPEALGKNAEKFEFFPQLIKLIDARDNLSVQVHPSDEFALENEGQYGKTEIWYILDAVEGAGIYYGFKKKITQKQFIEHLNNNTLMDVLQFVPVKAGESYFIPSGTVHAIGKGLLIAEVQQNSNVTYRVYDFGRVGADGKPRELHVDKAKQVINFSPVDASLKERTECEYFVTKQIKTNGYAVCFNNPISFQSVLVIDGEGTLNQNPIKKFDTFFIPANSTACIQGECTLLLSYVSKIKEN